MIKNYLIIFHVFMLAATISLTFINLNGMFAVTFPVLLLNAIVILLLINESRYILIPSVLLIFIFTFVFALMVIGNIVWSNVVVFLIIIAYLLFLSIQIITIVYALKRFKKEV